VRNEPENRFRLLSCHRPQHPCTAPRQGRWALYPIGDQVVVVWPGGTLAGPPAEVARQLNRLGDGHDDLDSAAARAIRQFVTDPAADDAARWSAARARTWSSPAIGYWLSCPTNQPGSGDPTPASWPGAPAPRPHPPIPLPVICLDADALECAFRQQRPPVP